MELTEKSVVMEINDECQKTSVALSSLAVVSQGRRSRPSTPKVTSSMDKIPTSLVERPASAPPVAARKDSTCSRGALVSHFGCMTVVYFVICGTILWCCFAFSHNCGLLMMNFENT